MTLPPPRLRVVLADDEPLARELLRRMLDARDDVVIVGEAATGDEALAVIRAQGPDLAFLDVRMPILSGMDLARAIPSPGPAIIFVTAYDSFAVEAFELRAVDYLLKPFDEERLAEAISRVRESAAPRDNALAALEAIRQRERPNQGRIYLTEGTRTVVRRFDQLDWIEADRKVLRVRSGGKTYTAPGPLSAVEARLDPGAFARISRSTIVNLDRVSEIQPWFNGELVLIMADGARLQTSRGFRARLDSILGRVPRRERQD